MLAKQPSLSQAEISLQNRDPTRKTRRPFGLKAIIFLLGLQVLVGIMVIALFWYANPDQRNELTVTLSANYTLFYVIVVQPLLVVARLVALVGLWRLRRWAWFLTMILLAYSLASDAIAFFLGDANFVLMFLNVLMVFYLNLHEVQTLFIARKLGDSHE